MNHNTVIYLLLVVVVLGGVFFVTRPQSTSPKSSSHQVVKTAPKTFTLVVKNRNLVSGPDTLKVTQGDSVVIKITVDEDEELHFHGYDKNIDLEKDKQGELSFTADAAGRFPYELEHSKTEIGALEVQPK